MTYSFADLFNKDQLKKRFFCTCEMPDEAFVCSHKFIVFTAIIDNRPINNQIPNVIKKKKTAFFFDIS